MLSMIGDAPTLSALRERARQAFGERIGMNWLASQQYRGQILEFLAPGSGKWPALRRVADAAGIAPEQIAAVGDDNNDVGMIRGAGFGIAMGNAVDEVRRGADLVVRSNAEGGVVEAIHAVLNAA
jgi:hydroxymethylpyrimidine pyrophosphatase-like HAD family hydrolase